MTITDYLDLAYSIGVRACCSAKVADSYFYGPNPHNEQTEKGIVIEVFKGTLRRMHTPLGFWNLGCSENVWSELPGEFMRVTKEAVTKRTADAVGPFFAVVVWGDQGVDFPVYRKPDQYLNKEKVVSIWNEFVSTRPNLRKMACL